MDDRRQPLVQELDAKIGRELADKFGSVPTIIAAQPSVFDAFKLAVWNRRLAPKHDHQSLDSSQPLTLIRREGSVPRPREHEARTSRTQGPHHLKQRDGVVHIALCRAIASHDDRSSPRANAALAHDICRRQHSSRFVSADWTDD